MIFLGIDAGTQGVRATAADENGILIASAHRSYEHFNLAPELMINRGYREQAPDEWWSALREVLIEIRPDIMKAAGDMSAAVTAVCIDGTSGTIVPLDENDRPIGNAIMYNDVRGNGGKALPKVRWCNENGAGPEHIKPARYVHHADYIAGRLTGEFGITDWSNALKSGYDVRKESWTAEAIEAFGPNLSKVAACGTPAGEIRTDDRELAYLNGAKLVAGASDGYMSAVATCAVNPGEWASIIGTTLILKGVTKNYIDDPNGCVYCHKHPQGYWMPGGASNVGGRCLNEWFGEENFEMLNRTAAEKTPTGMLEYPLMVPGERFPFLDGAYPGFGAHNDFTAVIEGIAYVERLCFETLEKLGCEVGDTVYSTGGACRSDIWLQIRSDVLGKTIKVPEITDAAIGGAMLAASGVYYSSLGEAVAHMGRIAKTITPQKSRYEEIYKRFRITAESFLNGK
ncbi:MAG: FGGY-family carbohydrate kinase [Lachnospiraceae bacterium]|nr:FGGY-family carbohydrate kinase [Lachnospiraceae bacterium]